MLNHFGLLNHFPSKANIVKRLRPFALEVYNALTIAVNIGNIHKSCALGGQRKRSRRSALGCNEAEAIDDFKLPDAGHD